MERVDTADERPAVGNVAIVDAGGDAGLRNGLVHRLKGAGGVDHQPWVLLSERHRNVGPVEHERHGTWQRSAKVLRSLEGSSGNQNLVADSRQATTDPRAETTITSEDEDAAQGGPTGLGPSSPQRRSWSPISPLTIAAWIQVAGHSLDRGPTSMSRSKGSTRLSDW